MALPNDIDLSQLDMNDPETRSYVQNNVDMNDKATKEWFDSTAPAPSGVPLMSSQNYSTIQPTQTNQQPSLANSFNESIERQGGFGISPEARATFNQVLPGLGEGADVAYRGYQGLMGATEAGAEGLDRLARATGLNKALSFDGNEFLPGTAAMALMEAFPLGGVEAGIAPHPVGRGPEPTRAPEPQIDMAAREQAIARNREQAIARNREQAIARNQAMNTELTQVLSSPDVTVNDINSIAQKYGVDPALFKNVEETVNYARGGGKGAGARSAESAVGIQTPATPKVTKADVDTHVENVTKNWKNAPDFETVQSINDIADPEIRAEVPSDALGFVGPDGKVRIIADNLNGPEDMQAVLFHEALGHHGLTARFRDGLDDVLDRMYDYGRNTKFRQAVDDFMERNPDAYADDFNPRARAAEEVLAEMSQNGEVPKNQMNLLRHQLRDFGRKAGFDVNFDDKEVSAILGMAHDATINGKTSALANGFRYARGQDRMSDEDTRAFMEYSSGRNIRPSELYRQLQEGANPEAQADINTRADQLRNIEAARERSANNRYMRSNQTGSFEETRRTDDGTIFLNYNHGNEKIPIKMAIEPDGTAEIAIDQFSTKANRLGPAQVRQAMLDLADKYPEIKRFGGYRRSGAGAGRVQELSVPERNVVESANRYMRRSYGSSEGMLQGKAAAEKIDEEGNAVRTPTSVVNAFRSNRNIEDILSESMPESQKQSFEEWIDKAGETKMTGKIASNLSKGTEVPELLAAQEFAIRSGNRIRVLQQKIYDGTATENDKYMFGREVQRLGDVSSSIMDVVSNASHILNSRKITIESDRRMQDKIRTMLAQNPEALNTPEGIEAIAKTLVKDEKKAKFLDKSLSVLNEALTLPRTLMATADLSAPFRQGFLLVGRKEFWKAFPDMFKQAASEPFFRQTQEEITSRPTYPLMQKARLAIADIDGHINQREEQFLSKWAEKIPAFGSIHRGAERAYTGFLNKVRADTFDKLIEKYKDMGVNIEQDPETMKGIARYVNNATGRGDLPGSWKNAAPALAGLFFSPRLAMSRFNTLFNPVYYAKLPPVVRAEAVKSLLSAGVIASTVLGLAASMGADVEVDPRSADFGKIKTGNTRYDILGGFGQYLTLAARLVMNETKNTRGDVKELGKGFGSASRTDIIKKFVQNKFAPVPSFVASALDNKTPTGEPFNPATAVGSMFVPLLAQDVADQIQKYGAEGVFKSVPSVFGVGIQDYGQNEYSKFNRVFPQNDANNPVATEMDRLNAISKKSLVNPVSDTISVEGLKIPLTEAEQADYNKRIGDEMVKILGEVINLPEYKNLSDKEKEEIVKEAHKEARDAAKADFLEKGLTPETIKKAFEANEQESK